MDHGQKMVSINFSDITAKAIAGYAIIGSAPEIVVTPETKDSIVNISYLANGQTNYYQFIDDDYQAGDPVINQKHNFAGKTGDRINLNITVPQNYDLAKGNHVPATYTFKANNNQPIVIHLVHHLSAITNDPKLMKKVTRTINVTKPGGTKLAPVVQRVSFIQTAAKDEVTGKVIYNNDWKANGVDNFAEYSVPVFAGYTASQTKVEKVIPNINTQNSTINITYQANPQKISVCFIDDDNQKQQVGSAFIINGVTDGNADFSTVTIPENYVLTEGSKLPTNHKFTANDQTVYTVELRHKTEDAKIDPNAKLSQKVSRTILITNIDGKVDKTIQEHTFTRTGKKDMVTGNISYGPWSENGKYTFAGIPVKEIAGYAINGSAPEVVVTPETKDSTINISYLANGQTSYYQFIDDDYQTGDPVINQKHPVAGKTDETIKLNISIPENYSLIEGSVLPTSYTFESGNKPIIIHLIHQKESLPNDTKTISRKVTIIDPDGKVDSKSTTQSVTFSRNDILDKVTNKHIYGKWNEAQQTIPSIDLPSFNGYTPTGEVTAAEVTTNSGDIADINISYVPNEQTSYYEFVDDDNHESLIAPATVISGRTGETIKLNIVTPNGYALAKDITLPRSYRFKATNNEPIIIHLVHHMSKVTNDPKLTKVITRTINVINPDGTTDSIVQTVRFVQTATKDDVTNSVSYMNDWKNVGAESFAEYNVPEIAGYTSSKTKVEKLTPKFGDQNVIVNIDYIKKSQINPVKPVKPIVTPIEKDNKEQSANKQQTVTAEPNSKPKVTQEIKQPVSKPNKTNGKILERKDRQTYKFQGQTVTMKKVVNAKEAGHINKIKAKKAALPQTGNDEAKTTAIIASGLAVDLSLIGLAGLKKKRSN